ncbi:UDP-N-acetylglucosamine 2-epimerase [Hoeflea marina]|uniref:UDP-N-acetylglucosamine 2-epimerase (non-hydrolyzing) n=1 Tax=Hoeflea marina TaxID=274592 RepID=A0A317PIF1_9HYPH|nr:UDP-N-acetylglucosamine 2-epimerase (non-hydrolyzing) [Hoeflea marina]PWW00222.1 UDP-N-acetylglucosamine 2-epimerase [Hoeflea marina]
MTRKKILCIVGTRPEAIKMAPVILTLRQEPWADVHVLATAQHRDLLDQVFGHFRITPDSDLDVMRPDQTLTALTARLLLGLDAVLDAFRPDAVLAQGDTTTVMTSSLACFYRRIAFGHVEAGLRTGDIANPFPEEANRVITGLLADWHFAPTESARQNLLQAGVDDARIWVTGNTVIDSLLMTAADKPRLGFDLPANRRLVLITAHRRENFGAPFEDICRGIRLLAERNPEVTFLYPVHPNPNVKTVAHARLGGLANVILSEPLGYVDFVAAMSRAHVIITDSGGVQEEAPALGKPVIVLRNETERPDAVEAGVVELVGTDAGRLSAAVQRLLDDDDAWRAMARGVSPYGDGHAAGRIVAAIRAQMS